MLHCNGRLRMTRGDYGVPLTLHVIEHCKECGEDLEPDDRICAALLRSGREVFSRKSSIEEVEGNDGLMELYFSKEEAAAINLGLYAFRVLLLRDGEVHNTLLTTILEVVP